MNLLKNIMLSAGLLCQMALFAEIDPDKALLRLQEGNTRYMKDQSTCPDRAQIRREAVSSKQKPFATIVGCSDSRVSPEILFDQGIGDLFVVRVAGNVVGPVGLDSIDYSVIYLGSNLIVVLGHENCGAVKAVLDNTTKDIETIAKLIEPAIKDHHELPSAIKANVQQVVKLLKESPVISRLVNEKKLKVVGGYYNLVSGKVDFLE
ncbi:MAG: carbonic anhydrase [Parachlamydia sp.]|nr:carbonic anhydrase [Parachlamydia sp.]